MCIAGGRRIFRIGRVTFMEVAGVGFQSRASCALLPARGRRSRRHPWRLGLGTSSDDRTSLERLPFNSRHAEKRTTRPMAGCSFLEVAGVEPASPNANRRHLQVYPSFQVVGEGAAERRAFLPVFRFVSPRRSGPRRRQASVCCEPRGRSRRRNRGPIAIGAYAARARVPLSLARKSLPNQEVGVSTCSLRS